MNKRKNFFPAMENLSLSLNTDFGGQPNMNSSLVAREIVSGQASNKTQLKTQQPVEGLNDLQSPEKDHHQQLYNNSLHCQALACAPNQLAPVQAQTRLALIEAEEIVKFRGNRRPGETLFSKGPNYDEFMLNFEDYCSRHGITTDYDKITALRMNIDHKNGDCSVIFSSALDANINKVPITYADLTQYLHNIYMRPITNQNLFRASSEFAKNLNSKFNCKNNPIKQLRKLELCAKELVKSFIGRKNFRNNLKNIEDTCLEMAIMTVYSTFIGENLSKTVLEELPPNLSPRVMFSKVLNALKNECTKHKNRSCANSRALFRNRPNDASRHRASRRKEQSRPKTEQTATGHSMHHVKKNICSSCQMQKSEYCPKKNTN